MLQYILQTVAFQLFFLIIYDVFLKKETFFYWNRAYLLVTALLSIVLPFIKIESFKEAIPQQFIIQLPEVILGNLTQTEPVLLFEKGIEQTSNFVINWQLLFVLGTTIAFLFFTYKLVKIIVLIYKNPKHWKGDLRIVELINSNAAFSFFHYVFLGEHINSKDKDTIIKHEIIHVKQNHSIDLLLFEILRILFWFNPLVYMYQNRIRTLHEYIADAKAIKSQDKSHYYENLLTQVFETRNVSFINTFFKKSLIKKRIVMLTKSRSKQILKFKYALLIPLVFGMLLYTSSNAQEKISNKEGVNQELSDEELKEHYYNQLVSLEAKKGSYAEMYATFLLKGDNYVDTREEYYKFQASIRRIFEKTKNTSIEHQGIKNDMLSIMNKTYAEYLEFKKTDRAKEIWENQIHDGFLKLVVSDMNNFTDEEQKDFDGKIKLLERDDFYTKFIVTDGKTSKGVQQPNKSKQNYSKVVQTPVVEDNIENQEVPFAVIENVPIYPGCETLSTNAERRKCMADKISTFVQQNFNADLAGDLGLKGRQRINVIFKIDKNGDVIGVRSRAPHPDLKAEAIRVISLLPKMIPGKQKGENVIVPYSLPIIFQIADKKTNLKEEIKKNKRVNQKMNDEESKHKLHKDWVLLEETIIEPKDYSNALEVPFAIIDEVPVFPGCETLSTNTERRKCTSDRINKSVAKRFNTDLAKGIGLKGIQRISTIFKIDKEGNVTEVSSRAPHPDLEAEAIRVIKTLPKFISGKHNGKNVIVPYALPIVFQVRE